MTAKTNWTARTADGGYSAGFFGADWSPTLEKWIATGFGAIQTAPHDGVTWTEETPPNNDVLLDVDARGALAVVVSGFFSGARIWTTPDASTWTERAAGSEIAPYVGVSFFSVARSENTGALVVTGNFGEIQVSTDGGITWVQVRTATGGDLENVAWGGVGGSAPKGTFVATGQNGLILTADESDLTTWTTRILPPGSTGTNLNRQAYSPELDRWVLGGADRVFVSDDDGVNWTGFLVPSAVAVSDVAWSVTAGHFTAAGGELIWVSLDGKDWWKQDVALPVGGLSVVAVEDENPHVLVAGGGTIQLQTSPLTFLPDIEIKRPIFFRDFQHLLPDSIAWRILRAGLRFIDQFFTGLAGAYAEACVFVEQVYLDQFPDSTRELSLWEEQFALPGTSTEANRRAAIAEAWLVRPGQSPRDLQDTMQAAGFDIFIHEWFSSGPPYVARDPRIHTEQPLVGTVQCGETDAQCGESGALCNSFLANEPGYRVNVGIPGAVPPAVPDDPDFFPFFLYWADEVFPNRATIDPARIPEFEELLLKICPTQQWLVLLTDYTEPP